MPPPPNKKIKEVRKPPKDPWAKFDLPMGRKWWNTTQNSDLLTDSEVIHRYEDENEPNKSFSFQSNKSTLDSTPDEGPSEDYLFLNKWAKNSLNLLPAKQRADTKFVIERNKSGTYTLDEDEEASDAFIPPSNKDAHTLFHVLNCCRSPGGKALLLEWIRKPLTNIEEINERLDMVEFFVNSLEARKPLSDQDLRTVPDLGRTLRKFEKNTITLRDLYSCYVFVRRLRDIVPLLADCIRERIGREDRLDLNEDPTNIPDAVSRTMIKHLVKPLNDLNSEFLEYVQQIDRVIDKERLKHNEISINPSYDEDLMELDDKLKELENKAEKIRDKAEKDLGVVPRMEVSQDYGYLMRVSLKDERSIRGKQKTYIPKLQTKKDGVRFVTKELIDINDDYLATKKEFRSRAKAVEEEVLGSFDLYKDHISHLKEVTSLLDVIVSLATAAVNARIPYVRPTVLPKGSGELILQQVRHPCLEKISDSFIPNDVEMSDKGNKFLVVQGPNMGGKSTYLRSVGMAVVMAQMGSFVACDEARISIMDSIFTRIGAGDRMLEGISTFMEEMLDASFILDKATENSLVLIDELGRGTSTHDGFGLAYAIAEKLVKMKSFVLFTTHFHEMSTLADKNEGVGNLHVKVAKGIDENDIIITFEMVPGRSSGSYGIQIAESLNFPPQVIEYAKKFEWIEEPTLELEEAQEFFELVKNKDTKGIEAFLQKVKSKVTAPSKEF